MRRVFFVALVFGGGLAVGRGLDRLPAEAVGDGREAGRVAGNGDTNGDGSYDVTDAVHLLLWLFGEGNAPTPCPSTTVVRGLPDTGKTLCTDQFGFFVDCQEDVVCPGQDGAYDSGCSPINRFVNHGDGTVTDNCTGLMWQENATDVNGDGNYNGNDLLEWCEALAHCESLVFAGHSDWRLPNVRELQSIVDYGRTGPARDSAFLGSASRYWTSTSVERTEDDKWMVYFNEGTVDHIDSSINALSFRAVRTAP